MAQTPTRRAPPVTLRVLGIDPGTRRLGWGVVERRGAKVGAIAAGVLKLSEKDALEVRLEQVHRALGEVIET